MIFQEILKIKTHGRSIINITDKIAASVSTNHVKTGLCSIFIRHTSASLIINENADPNVLQDLENFFTRLVPDGDPSYLHDMEGDDDMPAHIRSALTATSLQIPIIDGKLGLGTWQGIYVWEHRHHPHTRDIIVTIMNG